MKNRTIKLKRRRYAPRGKRQELEPRHIKLLYKYMLFLAITTAIFAPIRGWLNDAEYTFVIEGNTDVEAQQPEEVVEEEIVYERDELERIVDEAFEIDEEKEKIKEMIKARFGEHYDKSMQLLSCENASLNPNAVNTAGNTPAGSRDIGIYQINEYWQGVHAKFLFDPETNIAIAWQIYKDSGYTFKMWTCGKKLGI